MNKKRYQCGNRPRFGKLSAFILILVSILCILGVAIGVSVGKKTPMTPPSASRLGKYKMAAVSSDAAVCSNIGRDVMLDGGNAVDAAVAVLFCIGVAHPQSAGIGGGFFMTIYNSTSGEARCLNAREVAPIAATENMYRSNGTLSQIGGLAVAVPGEVAGSWEAHQAYGVLPWARLVMPSVYLAEKGIPVNFAMADGLKKMGRVIKAEPSMSNFINQKTGEVLQKGDIVKRPLFAETLKAIATDGADIFYKGTIGDKMVGDVQQHGGILTKDDLLQYRAEWMDPISVNLKGNLSLLTFPPPGSGVLAAFVMNILDGNLPKGSRKSPFPVDGEDPLTYHRIAEAFKFAYAERTKLGDPLFEPSVKELAFNLTLKSLAEETLAKINDSFTSNNPSYYGAVTYNPDDSGTSHISVLDADGLAVSVTSTVNLLFGAGFASEQTGIIMNDEMDDFSAPDITNYFGVPPSQVNFIKPGKRPLSSMCPSIITDTETGRVRMVIGAAGGTKITTSTIYAMIRHLWFGETIKESIDSYRVHHQLFPMLFQYDDNFPEDILKSMEAKGHILKKLPPVGAVLSGISVEDNGFIYANADHRKGGDVAGVDPIDGA